MLHQQQISTAPRRALQFPQPIPSTPSARAKRPAGIPTPSRVSVKKPVTTPADRVRKRNNVANETHRKRIRTASSTAGQK